MVLVLVRQFGQRVDVFIVGQIGTISAGCFQTIHTAVSFVRHNLERFDLRAQLRQSFLFVAVHRIKRFKGILEGFFEGFYRYVGFHGLLLNLGSLLLEHDRGGFDQIVGGIVDHLHLVEHDLLVVQRGSDSHCRSQRRNGYVLGSFNRADEFLVIAADDFHREISLLVDGPMIS